MTILPRVALNALPLKDGFQINKYVRGSLSFIVWVIGVLLAFSDYIDWNRLVGVQTAGTVIGVIGAVKLAYTFFAPKPGVPTVPTGNPIITSVAQPGPTPPAPPPPAPPAAIGG